MKKLPFFLLLILLLELTISVNSQNPSLLKFVLQWPPTFCINLNSAPQPGRCKEPIPQHSFTLHGLWPADQNGYSITCPQPPDPNWNQVFTTTVENQLMTFWPPLRENAQKRDLWKHEWRTHGACTGTTVQPLQSAQVYFNTAIKINNMLKRGNLFNYLKTSGIIACDSLSFARKDIVDAIQKVFVLTPPLPPPLPDVYLTCIPIDSRNNTHIYLSEVTLCTNLAGTSFISCPSQAASRSCSTGARIMLPHPKHQPRSPPPPRQPPSIFQEKVDMTYPTFERSWAKYIFNG